MPVTKRNREIRRLVVEEGRTLREVADQFGIGYRRVSAIIAQIDKKGVSEARRKHREAAP